jgi:hypothetical protein
MIAKEHHFSAETRRVAVELWNAKVPLKKIRDQQQMSKAILMCLLAYARDCPYQPIKPLKTGIGLQNLVVSMPRMLGEVISGGGNPCQVLASRAVHSIRPL